MVVNSVARLMGWVKANLAGPRSVRGIIVAHQFTERAKLTSRLAMHEPPAQKMN